MKVVRFGPWMLAFCGVALLNGGCVVPQPPGGGKTLHRVEHQTRAGYYLYLPDDYVANNGKRPDRQRWPVVVTFHGMRPWDDARPQVREWQQEADRYGLIVIAPELRTSDSFMQYPLRNPDLPYVKRDEKATLAIMDEVFRTTNADPSNVLATSWSCGGYLAHFMVNRHPERFSCLAVRQSNFNEEMLSVSRVPQYRNMRIGIFFGENDLPACRQESIRAVEWYRKYHFPVSAKYVSGLGHERTPQTAAAFFAASIGIPPKTPPDLARLVLKDIPTDDMSSLRTSRAERKPPAPAAAPSVASSSVVERKPPERNMIFDQPAEPETASLTPKPPTRVPPADTSRRPVATLRPPPAVGETPRRPIRPQQPYSAGELPGRSESRNHAPTVPQRERREEPPLPAQLKVHGSTSGPAPFWVSLSIDLPERLKEGASVLWMDNNRTISVDGFEATRLLREPGEHTIKARILTADDRSIILRETFKVLPPASQPTQS